MLKTISPSGEHFNVYGCANAGEPRSRSFEMMLTRHTLTSFIVTIFLGEDNSYSLWVIS